MSEKKQIPRTPGGRRHPVRRRAPRPADPQRRPLPGRRRALRRGPREVGRARRGRRQPDRRRSSPSSRSAIRRPTIRARTTCTRSAAPRACSRRSSTAPATTRSSCRGSRASGSTTMTQTAPYLKAKVRRLDEQSVDRRRGRGAQHEPARHRQAGHPAHARAPARGGLAHRLDPGPRAPSRTSWRRNLDAPVDEKARLLETVDVKERIRKVLKLLTRQLEILKMRERINSQIKEEMGKNQREYVLRQQLKAIKEELGEDEGDQGDLDGLEERIAKANLPHGGRAGRQEAAQAPAQHAGRAAPSTRSCARTSTGSSTCRGTTQTPDNMDIARRAQGPRRGPLRPREGQEAHPRVPRGPQAEEGQEGPDPLPHRSARRRQDVARPQHRARARPQVRPHLARRRARRGGNPRPPAHVRRRAARADHPGDEEGGRRSTPSS